MKKTLLVDCDGVVLNWEYAFDCFMEEHGHTKIKDSSVIYNIGERYGIELEQGRKLIKIFNDSAAIGFLPPLRDAVQYVTKLADEGWDFIAITSLSTNKYAKKLRVKNLAKLFGKETFSEVTCLPTGADKDRALAKFAGSGLWWIEDKIENAVAGLKVGLKPLLVEHGFNMDYDHPEIPLVKNWKEIYEIVTGTVDI
jgi:hypothetical protein